MQSPKGFCKGADAGIKNLFLRLFCIHLLVSGERETGYKVEHAPQNAFQNYGRERFMNIDFENRTINRRSFLKGAGVVGAAGLLAACGGGSSSTAGSASASASASSGAAAASGSGLSELVTYEVSGREIESWNMLYSQLATNFNVSTNMWDGLLSFDNYGKVVPAIAKSWEHNDDASVWTFHLRDDVDWVDINGEVKDHLTSKDFLVGFEWVLNAKKNEAANTSMPSITVVGATDYYDKTDALDNDAAYALTYEDMLAAGVGIEAPDDYTLVFTCMNPCPYFDTVASYVCCYPAPPALIDELGVDGFRGVTYDQMWSCGPYLIEEFVQDNTKSFVPNPNYYDADNVTRFDRVTVNMISDLTVGYQLYQNRELDELELSESTLTTIQADASNPYNDQLCEKRPTKYAYDFHFNYHCLNEDGSPNENWNKAVANESFRRCFQEGVNLIPYYARFNKINPLKCENNFYTMKGICYNSKGEDYTTLVAKELGIENEAYDGETMIHLRKSTPDSIKALKEKAMEELTAIGVTFPVKPPFYFVAGNTVAQDNATVLKQCFIDSFGEDFIQLDLRTYVSSFAKEVRTPKMHAFVINGWGADFGDPVNFVGQEILHDDNAYYAIAYSNIPIVADAPADYQKDLVASFEEFTDLVNAANAIVDDTDARYEAFAKAEAYMINHSLAVPCYYDVRWCLTHVNEYSKINAMFGPCNYKYVNWETSEDAYTTAQYEAFAKAFDSATA